MEEKRLLITTGANAAYYELHATIINWTSQRHPLADSETVQLHQLLSDDGALFVADECLPLGLGHFYFCHDFAKLAGIDSEVGEEVFLVFINATKPAERNHALNAWDRRNSLLLGHGQSKPQRDSVPGDQTQGI